MNKDILFFGIVLIGGILLLYVQFSFVFEYEEKLGNATHNLNMALHEMCIEDVECCERLNEKSPFSDLLDHNCPEQDGKE